MEKMGVDFEFYKNKKIFITGHTGFKGVWLCKILQSAGAKLTGYALEPNTEESKSFFDLSGIESRMTSHIGDIRDYEHLKQTFDLCDPQIVIHLAAQPLVIEGYEDPVGTYSTNVMGTVNILECIRNSEGVKSFLNVTTDKVYLNREVAEVGYIEEDQLDGFDPYSNSKSCSELVTHSYKSSFLNDRGISISTARAGNVIGGGDFAANRIIPDCIRAALKGNPIIVRNAQSVRPYQHVLEPLYAYLMILEAQYDNQKFAGYYNVGPDDDDCITTGKLAELFSKSWGEGMSWKEVNNTGPHEARFLKLNCSKLKTTFNWKPLWNINRSIEKTVEWAKVYQNHGDIASCMDEQINIFFR